MATYFTGTGVASGRRVPAEIEAGVVAVGKGVAGVRYPASPGAGLAEGVGPLPSPAWVPVRVVPTTDP